MNKVFMTALGAICTFGVAVAGSIALSETAGGFPSPAREGEESVNPFAPTGNEEVTGTLQLLYHPSKDKVNKLEGAAQLGEGAEGWTMQCMDEAKTLDPGTAITVNGKAYASIKTSNGKQNTVTLPEGYVANAVTIYSVMNTDAAETICYFQEVDGVTYPKPDHSYLESWKDYDNPDVSYFPLSGKNSFTFTNSGKQVLVVLVVDYSEAVEEQSPFGDGELAAPASVWPKNNAQYLPLNGSIKVAYPEDVTVDVYGKATIGDKQFPLSVADNVVSIDYTGLTPDAEVTVTIPAKGIGNEEASNAELSYKYTTAPANLLFYSDFNNYPYDYFLAYPAGSTNFDILAKSSTDKTATVGDMTFFSGTKGRVVALGGNVCSDNPDAEYGPYTETDAGASPRAVQLMDGGNNLYFETPEVQGPCVVTLYLGNATPAAGTMLLTDERGLKDTPLAELKFEKAKRIFKYTVEYPYSGPVKFRLYNQKIKVDINDVIIVKGEGAGIPRPDENDTEAPVVTAKWPGTAPYAPTAGTVTLKFNEPVIVDGKATLDDKDLDVVVEGNTILVAYEGLEAGKNYTMTLPAVSDASGNTTEPINVEINTRAADVLFYTDFSMYPYSFYQAYGDLPNDAEENRDIIAKNSTDKTVTAGDITYFSGTNGRVVAMGKVNIFESDEENAGASARCIQLNGGGGALYAELPEVDAPCAVTLYVGNSGVAAGTFYLKDAEGTELAAFELPAEKKMYKYSYTYEGTTPVKLRIYNNALQFNLNDILVEKVETPEPQSPFGDGELAAPASVWPKNNAQYLPLNGTIKVAYPEDVTVDVYGNATIGGKECALAVENNVVTISYEGLEPDTEVTLTIPAKGIGNEEASNAEMVYNYKTAPQDLLFYTDFNNFPYEFFVECPAGTNKDLIAKGSTDKTYEIGGMTFFSGTKGRVVALGDNVCSPDLEADYGPYTEADAGATGRAVQLIDGGNGLYFETPEVEGPCDITLYLGNAGAAAGTMLLTDERGLKDTPLAELTFEAAKKIFKYTVNYPYSGPVKFRLYNQKIKVDINDFIVVKGEGAGIPRPDDTDTEAPVMTSVWPGTAPYAPTAGTVTVAYNEPVTVAAKATLDGKDLDVVVEGNTVLVAYEGLEAGKKYTMTVPAVSDEAGNISEPLTVEINTAAADVLYYTDFNQFPYSFYQAYGDIPNDAEENRDIIAKNSTDVTAEAGGITYYSGTTGRVVAMGKSNVFEADAENEGASARCIQLIGGAGELYAQLPEVQGPCMLTIYVGNTTGNGASFFVKDAQANELAEFQIPAEKKMYKYTYTFDKAEAVALRIYNNANQFNINDILVEKAEETLLDAIEAAAAADAVYYNLQGIRVENPAAGLYIRVRGEKVDKVVIR